MERPRITGPLVRAAALSLLLCGVVSSSASAASFEKAIWGPLTMPSGKSAFPTYRKLGVDTFEIQLVWADVARWRPRTPTDPRDKAYRWPAEIRDAIRMSRASGIRVAVMVKGTPNWANGNQGVTVPPTADADLAHFFTAAVHHYPSVRRWMVWGEPSRLANWSPIPLHTDAAPRRYATLLEASYQAIKQADPRAIVIGGMTFSAGDVFPGEWVRFMLLPNGKPPHLDWWGHNPYSPRKPDLALMPIGDYPATRDMSDIDTLQEDLRSVYGSAGRPVPRIFISEWNISTDRSNRAFGFYVSRPEQAVWLTDSFAIAHKLNIAGLGWYGLYDEPDSVNFGVTFGLMDKNAVPKAAFESYRLARSAPPPGR